MMRPVTLILVCLVAGASSAQTSSARLEAPKVVALHAMPFYPDTGEIARDKDLFDPKLALTNVTTGSPKAAAPEWRIKGGTTVTYVEVEVAWPEAPLSAGMKAMNAIVELEARAVPTNRLVQKQSVSVNLLDTPNGDLIRVPFFVYGTGCEQLKLTASGGLNGKVDNSKSRIIPFRCFE